MSKWKRIILSFAGKVCFIKSILSAIPLFYLSFFKISRLVSKEIVKLQRKFYGDEENKIAWIKWEDLSKDRDMGGLGIKDIHHKVRKFIIRKNKMES